MWRISARTNHLGIAATAAALLCLAAAAQAQTADPYTTAERQATQSNFDTDLTPVAKETDLWTLAAGAEFGETEVIEGSVTSFDTDLFDVAFYDPTIGLMGGSACPSIPIRQSGESDSKFGARVAICESPDGETSDRIPVLYRYSEPENTDPSFEV